MRSYDEMMKLIMDKASEDSRIRAVAMDGSRVTPSSTVDRYSDFDIVYYVEDIRAFTKDKNWVTYFGEILIVQYPEDWYKKRYDYDSRDRFNYLIQFVDGNRIDLSLIDLSTIDHYVNTEPRKVLLDKDGYQWLKPIETDTCYFISKPTEFLFYNICNEFRWLSLYVSKGLCRNEFNYARQSYEYYLVEMLIKMLEWYIGINHGFEITTGSSHKYLKRYLTNEEMDRFMNCFPSGNYEDIWAKLFYMYEFFYELECFVGNHFSYEINHDEMKAVRAFLVNRKASAK